MKPNLFVIGAPKCGTTTLFEYLKNHSRIFFPVAKEPHFFGTDLGLRSGGYRKDIASYRKLYETAPGNALYLGDASVFYLYSREAAANIRFFNPDARIICLLRQPADMMYSMFAFCLRHGAETIRDFEQALAAEPDRRNGKRIPRSVFIEETLHYRALSDYAPQLERYYELFPRKNILVLFFEDLKNEPAKFFQTLATFLGVENEFEGMFFHANRTGDVAFTPSKVLNRKYPQMMTLVRKYIPDPIRKKLQFLKNVERAPKNPPPLSPKLREALTMEKKTEIQALSALTGHNLDHWLSCE